MKSENIILGNSNHILENSEESEHVPADQNSEWIFIIKELNLIIPEVKDYRFPFILFKFPSLSPCLIHTSVVSIILSVMLCLTFTQRLGHWEGKVYITVSSTEITGKLRLT
jgi:hypothetical protein